MSGSISILQGVSFNNTSSYLRRSGREAQREVFSNANSDANFIIYNNIYNNYLRLYLENDFEQLQKFNVLDSIIALARSLDQVISFVLLDTLSVVQRGMIQYSENNALRNEVDELKKKLEDIDCKRAQFNGAIKAEVNVDVSLDVKYLLYVKEHGPPINGLFDSRKLAEVIQKYNLFEV